MRILFFSLFFFLVSAWVVPLQAQVVINEVFPAPSSGNEWVELYNLGDQSVNLQGWSVEDQLTTPSVLKTFGASDVLAARSYLTIDVSGKLNNSGDGVTLKNASAQVVNQMSYTSSQTDLSWARQPDGTGSFVISVPTKGIQNPQSSPSPSPSPSLSPSPTTSVLPTPSSSPSPTPLPTPTPSPSPSPSATPTPSPTPIAYPPNLEITEIMACPDIGESEWVEIYNPDDTSYSLNGWKVKDVTGNSRTVSTTVGAQSYAVFTLSSAILNNTGDTLTLERPDGVQYTPIQLDSCKKNMSFIFSGGFWQLTATPTKASANVSPDEENTGGTASTSFFSSSESDAPSTVTTTSSAILPSSVPHSSPLDIIKRFYTAARTPNLSVTTASTSTVTATLTPDFASHSDNTTPSTQVIAAPQLPKWLNKYSFTAIATFAVLIIAIGSYFGYQWYTEYHAKQDLEFM